MDSILTVTSAAANRLLVTLDQVKAEMVITDTASDALLEILRTRVSQSIASECGRQFARDTITQTFREVEDEDCLILGHAFPDPERTASYCTITSVTEDDVLLDAADYEIDAASGLLYRLYNDVRCDWNAEKIVVVFSAGYVLPDDSGSTLPAEISGAAVELIRAAKFSAASDPSIRSEDILSGLYSYTKFDPMKADTSLPATVTDVLNKYRNISIA